MHTVYYWGGEMFTITVSSVMEVILRVALSYVMMVILHTHKTVNKNNSLPSQGEDNQGIPRSHQTLHSMELRLLPGLKHSCYILTETVSLWFFYIFTESCDLKYHTE